ncbi:hypothetical protein PM001_21430 [[Clostridium] symbiosum]|uniref:hypothetical protein n=1 Tax=Clostridium symbiosum TaxID=1512 RepID=UPI00189CECA1|nr:hypothetical protein [[Clostridium] symbiosum]MDB2038653.1 hypothetical protein [[Clostridium] symbiosum]
MKIKVSEIQNIAMAICIKYIENNGEYLETEQDNYWFVDMEQAIDLKKEPDSWCVGSLEDDYLCLEEIISQKRDVSILDFDRISNLFRLISYEIEKSKKKML